MTYVTIALVIIIVILLFLVPWKSFTFETSRRKLEVNEIELGIGSSKVTLTPNDGDIEVAYKLWVELMTRKLGLPFDEEHDVILEVYNSWYEFFKITRELIKTIPVTQVIQNDSTRLLVTLSIDVLNKAIRPHLTKWQARYRFWYDKESNATQTSRMTPQDIQQKFPEYPELVKELKTTNKNLLAYAKLLSNIVDKNLHENIFERKVH